MDVNIHPTKTEVKFQQENVIFSAVQKAVRQTLLAQYQSADCGACWTSCRGNFETLMHGPHRWRNLLDGYRVSKGVPLARN